jgi:hypothetical protein
MIEISRRRRTFDQVMTDDEALEAFVRNRRRGVAASRTRRRARPTTRCMVDTEGRAGWRAWLRVVDASVFPVVPCANAISDADDGVEKCGVDRAISITRGFRH